MATLELVERLLDYADVSYQEANDALNACNDDILDAIVYLENQGKIKRKPEQPKASTAHYTTQPEPKPKITYNPPPEGETFGDLIKRFANWLKKVMKGTFTNYFVVSKRDEVRFSMPIVILLLCLILSVGFVLVLLFVGLFLGYSYSFEGEHLGRQKDLKNAMDTASRVTKEVKDSLKNTQQSYQQSYQNQSQKHSSSQTTSQEQAKKEFEDSMRVAEQEFQRSMEQAKKAYEQASSKGPVDIPIQTKEDEHQPKE